MSMMIANAWVKEPISGWEQVEVDTTKPYDGLGEVMEDFARNGREGGKGVPRLHQRQRSRRA